MECVKTPVGKVKGDMETAC
uniref:Uncharacterized protein n=1 Tax=Anguilla anguilla TaxID=7936 RepID=A0A0E9RGL5_ANGAN